MNVPESILNIFESILPEGRIVETIPWFMLASGDGKVKSADVSGYEQEILDSLVERLETEINKPEPAERVIRNIEDAIEGICGNSEEGGYVLPDWIREELLSWAKIDKSIYQQMSQAMAQYTDQQMMQPPQQPKVKQENSKNQ